MSSSTRVANLPPAAVVGDGQEGAAERVEVGDRRSVRVGGGLGGGGLLLRTEAAAGALRIPGRQSNRRAARRWKKSPTSGSVVGSVCSTVSLTSQVS